MTLGHPILSNIIILGAPSAVASPPIKRTDVKAVISGFVPGDAVDIHLRTFDHGREPAERKGKNESVTVKEPYGGDF